MACFFVGVLCDFDRDRSVGGMFFIDGGAIARSHASTILKRCDERTNVQTYERTNVLTHTPSCIGVASAGRKKETPAFNVFAAASSDLCTMVEGGVPDPLVKALPIQRVNVSRVTIEVEGKPIQFRVDADANPSLMVPERIAMQVLARKYGTLAKMGQYITLGQAVVTMQYGRV
ncbi:MAG: hypothetical protein GY820_22195, partial [Gammaproteobacteria bacterium]|nr:hypothetical protein [Gammaproteobacteria bacterium]